MLPTGVDAAQAELGVQLDGATYPQLVLLGVLPVCPLQVSLEMYVVPLQ